MSTSLYQAATDAIYCDPPMTQEQRDEARLFLLLSLMDAIDRHNDPALNETATVCLARAIEYAHRNDESEQH